MKRPDYLFAGKNWAVFPDPKTGGRLADGSKLFMALDRIEVNSVPYIEELERGIWAWLMARGIRSITWNGRKRTCSPDDFDFCVPRNPQRVISVCPSNTEWLNLLQLQDRVIALDSTSPFDADVPRLGRELTLDINLLCDLNPDLVIASLSVPGMEKVVSELVVRAVPHMVLAPQTLAEIRTDCVKVAHIFNAEDVAKPFLDTWDLAFAPKTFSSLVPTFLEWWPKPIFCPAQRCWTNQLLELAGAKNIFCKEKGQSIEVAPEMVVAMEPELAIVSWCGVPHHKLTTEKMKHHPLLREMPAVRHDQVYVVNEDFLGRPGPGLIKGLDALKACVQKVLERSKKICAEPNN